LKLLAAIFAIEVVVVFLFMTVFGGIFSSGVYTVARFIAGV
jgi:hypothetical protein